MCNKICKKIDGKIICKNNSWKIQTQTSGELSGFGNSDAPGQGKRVILKIGFFGGPLLFVHKIHGPIASRARPSECRSACTWIYIVYHLFAREKYKDEDLNI